MGVFKAHSISIVIRLVLRNSGDRRLWKCEWKKISNWKQKWQLNKILFNLQSLLYWIFLKTTLFFNSQVYLYFLIPVQQYSCLQYWRTSPSQNRGLFSLSLTLNYFLNKSVNPKNVCQKAIKSEVENKLATD